MARTKVVALMAILDFACRHQFASGFTLDLSLAVERRFTVLFGPSGSGKTSVLSMIAGFLQPAEGAIRLRGQTLLDTAAKTCLPPDRRGVGMVFQDSLLFPHLSVEGNLLYGQRHRKRQSRRVDPRRVVRVLEIEDLLNRRADELSGGQRQRVALGRALLSSPELLLMDEPLASLDVSLRDRVLDYLERIVAEWDIPTIYVTHAQVEVRRVAQWVLLIENGRLVGQGTPDEALAQPRPLTWGNSAGLVNLLRLTRVEDIDGRRDGWIGPQRLLLPAGGPTPRFVQFSPKDVMLSRRDVEGISARNHLRGHVCKLIEVEDSAFVAVDVGAVVWAEVTRQAARDLQLESGAEVVCLLKSHRIELID